MSTNQQNKMASNQTTRSLVTGGAGFIGSHLVEALLARGDEVRVLDDFSSGRLENLPTSNERLEVLHGSISDTQMLNSAMNGVEVVFHLAAMVAVPESVDNPQKCLELNDLGAYNTYMAAEENQVRRVVFSSSSAVYGDQSVPHHENICPKPDTPYAIHKLLGEHYGIFFYKYRQLESVYLRYFNVYGPRQLPDSPYSGVISLFMDQLRQGQTGVIYGDGQQTRDFIHVDDVVSANIAAALSPKAPGLAFNIGSGTTSTINTLYRILSELAGQTSLKPTYREPRAGDITHSSGPVDLARDVLNFCPTVTLAPGLADTWKWLNNYLAQKG